MSVTGRGESLSLPLVPEQKIEARLKAGLVRAPDRATAIGAIFEEAGCHVTSQPADRKHSNVICTLPGETESVIAVGGHYDFADRGDGIVDDWSGVSLLPSLFETLKQKPRKHSFVFIAFALEENGLIGSKRYVRKLTAVERTRYRAFVNLECLGMGPTNVWVKRSDPGLVIKLAQVAAAFKLPLAGVNVDQVGDDDTHFFRDAGIPVLSLHSVTQQTLKILHSKRDRVEAIDIPKYYEAYRLAAFSLAYLDKTLE